jgi:hypothetical protein
MHAGAAGAVLLPPSAPTAEGAKQPSELQVAHGPMVADSCLLPAYDALTGRLRDE